MTQMIEVVAQFFKAHDWFCFIDENSPVAQTVFQGKNGEWACYAVSDEPNDRLAFYSICPIRVPEEKRTIVAEFITRVNYNLIMGNFELDFDDGETRFKTSVDVEGSSLSREMIESLVFTNVTMMDRYLPGFMKLMYGDISAADAVEEIEKAAPAEGEEQP